MTAKIIPLGGVTRLNLPVDRVLEAAKTELKDVVILGWDNDGCEYFASNMADGGSVLWLLQRCIAELMEESLEEE